MEEVLAASAHAVPVASSTLLAICIAIMLGLPALIVLCSRSWRHVNRSRGGLRLKAFAAIGTRLFS